MFPNLSASRHVDTWESPQDDVWDGARAMPSPWERLVFRVRRARKGFRDLRYGEPLEDGLQALVLADGVADLLE